MRSDSDLGQMLMVALDVTPVANVVEASMRYGGMEIRAEEQAARSGERPWCASCRTVLSMAPCLSFRQAVAGHLMHEEPRLFPERGRCTSCRTVCAVTGGRWRRWKES